MSRLISVCSVCLWKYSPTLADLPSNSLFFVQTREFIMRFFKWTFTFEMWFIPSWTNRFKPHPHTRHLSGLTPSPSKNVACLLTFAWLWTRIAMTLGAEIWRFGYSKPYDMSDLIKNIVKTSQVRWKLKIDTWLIIYNVNISNKFNSESWWKNNVSFCSRRCQISPWIHKAFLRKIRFVRINTCWTSIIL